MNATTTNERPTPTALAPATLLGCKVWHVEEWHREPIGSPVVCLEDVQNLVAILDKFARSVREFPCGHKPNYASGDCEACQALREYDALALPPNAPR
jgi:hypothetical protein